ncbi:hypothetical protein D3C75_858330 [compost metagenome]
MRNARRRRLLVDNKLETGIQCHVEVLKPLKRKILWILRQKQGMDDSCHPLRCTSITTLRFQIVQRQFDDISDSAATQDKINELSRLDGGCIKKARLCCG